MRPSPDRRARAPGPARERRRLIKRGWFMGGSFVRGSWHTVAPLAHRCRDRYTRGTRAFTRVAAARFVIGHTMFIHSPGQAARTLPARHLPKPRAQATLRFEASEALKISMTEVIEGSLYDYPTYYDLVFGSDWQAEFRFLQACFDKHAHRPVRSLFEPACGTGRLLIKFAESGYEVAGNDLNPHAVEFCNARFVRRGLPPAATVGDMSAFLLKRKVDAMYNMINSFRHLLDESAAESHLHCVARGLAKGGLYVLGLHLTPTVGEPVDAESWSARRGNLAVTSSLWSEGIDHEARAEKIGMEYDVYTPTRHFKIVDSTIYRTYTAEQLGTLLSAVPDLEVEAVYDFSYEIDQPITVDESTEDAVFVFRRR